MLHLGGGGKFSKYTQYACYFVACDGLQPSRLLHNLLGYTAYNVSWHVAMFLCVSDSFVFFPNFHVCERNGKPENSRA